MQAQETKSDKQDEGGRVRAILSFFNSDDETTKDDQGKVHRDEVKKEEEDKHSRDKPEGSEQEDSSNGLFDYLLTQWRSNEEPEDRESTETGSVTSSEPMTAGSTPSEGRTPSESRRGSASILGTENVGEAIKSSLPRHSPKLLLVNPKDPENSAIEFLLDYLSWNSDDDDQKSLHDNNSNNSTSNNTIQPSHSQQKQTTISKSAKKAKRLKERKDLTPLLKPPRRRRDDMPPSRGNKSRSRSSKASPSRSSSTSSRSRSSKSRRSASTQISSVAPGTPPVKMSSRRRKSSIKSTAIVTAHIATPASSKTLKTESTRKSTRSSRKKERSKRGSLVRTRSVPALKVKASRSSSSAPSSPRKQLNPKPVSTKPPISTSSEGSSKEAKLAEPLQTGFTLMPSGSPVDSGVFNTILQGNHVHFKVRSRGYAETGEKQPSQQCLFYFAGADCFSTTRKAKGVFRNFKLPDAWKRCPADPIQPTLIIHMMIPGGKPSLWGKQDGIGWSQLLAFQLNQHGRDILSTNGRGSNSGLAQLIKRTWATDCKALAESKCRIKFIPILVNANAVKLGKIIRATVNANTGRPFVGLTCTEYYKTNDVLVCELDVHKFSYLAKEIAETIRPEIQTMVIDFAVLLEASGDELPENLLGCVRYRFPNMNLVKPLHFYHPHMTNVIL